MHRAARHLPRLQTQTPVRKHQKDASKPAVYTHLRGQYVISCIVQDLGAASRGRMASAFSGPMGDLLIALEEGREPATSARRNLPTMRQILAEDRSAREGGAWIDL